MRVRFDNGGGVCFRKMKKEGGEGEWEWVGRVYTSGENGS